MKKTPVLVLFFSMVTVHRSCIGQSSVLLQSGDSLYAKKNWAGAKMKYDSYLKTDDSNSIVWNRRGFCNQNLGFLPEALSDYTQSLQRHPSPSAEKCCDRTNSPGLFPDEQNGECFHLASQRNSPWL